MSSNANKSRVVRTARDHHQGQILNGRYRLNSLLSQGGSGAVYMARCVESGDLFAIKILRSELNLEPRIRQRFLMESRAASRIRHPAVIHAKELGETSEGDLFFVMEYVPGPPLRKLMGMRKLDIPQSIMIAAATAEGLKAAHELDVIHRDLKPENILIPRNSNAGSVVKIADFGIARLLNTPRITTTNHVLGTPSYLSPEQISGLAVDRRTDIYSLGIIMYEMISGQLPFYGETTEELLDSHVKRIPVPLHKKVSIPLSPALEWLVMACLEKSPDNRPSSMDEVLRVLATL
ncbi:MAG: serine/threonine protein kinase [Deltaproteobacteria bacterium]|nr:serine/threonine protein kinase [Deltaproteobacteria bacterium]